MRRQIIARACGTLLAAVLLASTVGACPAGSIAGAADLIMAPLGPIIVESCMSDGGGLATYTYEITNGGRAPIELCRFTVPGLGTFSTIGSAEPLGLTLTIEEASGCATWWAWEGTTAEILPGETVTLSISLNTATTPTLRDAYVALCDGTKEPAQVLAPSTCSDITDDRFAGCFCGDGTAPCESTGLFEGEGTQINLLGGPERQVLAVCDESWVRHGFGIGIEDLDRYDFRLEIDGVDVPLEQRAYCVPRDVAGGAHLGSLWHVQFPADHFEAGRAYEFVGSWYDYSADPGDRLIFSRRVEVQVLPCLVPVTLLPSLADLIVRIDELDCDCGWTPQQAYECSLTIQAVVVNQGGAPSTETFLRVRIEGRPHLKVIPALAPSEEYTVTVKTTVATAPPGQQGQCPIKIIAEIDSTESVEESDEENNADSTCCE